MGRPFFPLFFKDRNKLQYLSMEQRGELLTALFDYAADGKLPNLDGVSGFAFEVFREGIDTSLAKYEETCQKRKEAARKGAAARWGNQSENKMPNGIHEMPNASDSMANHSKNAEIEAEAEAEAEGEAEEEGEGEAEAEGTPHAAVSEYFENLFGRRPDASFLQTADNCGFNTSVIKAALDECKAKGARKPEAYARTVLQRWSADGVPAKYQHRQAELTADDPMPDWMIESRLDYAGSDEEIDAWVQTLTGEYRRNAERIVADRRYWRSMRDEPT